MSSIIKFAKKENLKELLDVYSISFPNTPITLEYLEKYLECIPNSILLGLIDDKIVAHLFMHPINNLNYDNFLYWSNYNSFDSNGEYLLIWGAGILKQYRTVFNFAWSIQNKLLEESLKTYKNVKYSITYVYSKTKLVTKWHLNFGYEIINVLNNVPSSTTDKDHVHILKMPIREHVNMYGFERLKRNYGYVSEGSIPIFQKD
jgi:hypothetical protein